MKYTSISGAFNWQKLYRHLVDTSSGLFIEIGNSNGKSLVYLLELIHYHSRKNKNSYTVHCIDTMDYRQKTLFFTNLMKFKAYYFADIIQLNPELAVKLYFDTRIDFIFWNYSHSYCILANNLPLWYNELKDGGVIAGTGYSNKDVLQAVNEFAIERSLQVEIWDDCWLIHKPIILATDLEPAIEDKPKKKRKPKVETDTNEKRDSI